MPGKTSYKTTLLGTGCPFVNPRRYGAETLVECTGQRFLIDIGSSDTQRLAQASLVVAAQEADVLVHEVFAHSTDDQSLVADTWTTATMKAVAGYHTTVK